MNTERSTIIILIVALFFLFSYLLAAFVYASFDIKDWGMYGRMGTVLFGMLGAGFFVGMFIDLSKD